MKISKPNSGLIIGTIFTCASLLLAVTFIFPILSVLPGVYVENFAKNCIVNEPYSNVGKLTILFLSIILLLTFILFLLSIRKQINKGEEISKVRIVGILSLTYFMVHSLGFYLYWGVSLDFRSDGQLIFGAVTSYPISSFSFIFIGLLIDLVKNLTKKKVSYL